MSDAVKPTERVASEACQGADEKCPHPVAWRMEQTDRQSRRVFYIELCEGHAARLRVDPAWQGLLRDGVVRPVRV